MTTINNDPHSAVRGLYLERRSSGGLDYACRIQFTFIWHEPIIFIFLLKLLARYFQNSPGSELL